MTRYAVLRPTLVKSLVCISLIAVSFLHPYSQLRLVIVEYCGIPLRPILGGFSTLFYRDKPFFNFYGSLVVLVIYAAMVYIVWSVVQHWVQRRKRNHNVGIQREHVR
jgi:hypothetical protein